MNAKPITRRIYDGRHLRSSSTKGLNWVPKFLGYMSHPKIEQHLRFPMAIDLVQIPMCLPTGKYIRQAGSSCLEFETIVNQRFPEMWVARKKSSIFGLPPFYSILGVLGHPPCTIDSPGLSQLAELVGEDCHPSQDGSSHDETPFPCDGRDIAETSTSQCQGLEVWYWRK